MNDDVGSAPQVGHPVDDELTPPFFDQTLAHDRRRLLEGQARLVELGTLAVVDRRHLAVARQAG